MNTVRPVETCVVNTECPECGESVEAIRVPYTDDCRILTHPEKNKSKKVVSLKPKPCVMTGEIVPVGNVY